MKATDHALLPCPFCGAAAVMLVGQRNFHDTSVMCNECGAEGAAFDCQDKTIEYIPDALERNMREAAAAWNRRTSLR